MSASKERVKDAMIGAVVMLLIIIPIMMSHGYFDPVPYSYVALDRALEEDGKLTVSSSFLKTDQCIFDRLEVFGEALGAWHRLDWRDVDGDQGDRIEGYHYMTLEIDTKLGPYTAVEIRTRHDCDGKKKDGIFLALDARQITRPE